MKKNYFQILAVILFFSIAAIGCPPPPVNVAPVIHSLTASKTIVHPDETVTLTCDCSDANGDTLTISWSVEDGTLSATDKRSVEWTAPAVQKEIIASVSVSDGELSSDDSITLTVELAITNVSGFTAQEGDEEVLLNWLNPSSSSFAGVKIQRKENGFPSGVTDGTEVYNGNGQTCNDRPLTNDITYYYKAFAFNADEEYANGVTARATPSAGAVIQPQITDWAPTGTDVAVDSNITATFNKSMNPTTIDNMSFTVSAGGTDISGTVSYSDMDYTATFSPDDLLEYSTIYTVTVSSAVEDAAGNAIQEKSWAFTTKAEAATIYAAGYPEVEGRPGGTSFDVKVKLLTWGDVYVVVVTDGAAAPTSQEVKAGTASGGLFPVDSASKNISDTSEYSLLIDQNVNPETPYDVYVATEDNTGNLQATPTKLDVMTDSIVPTVTAFSPADGATGVAAAADLQLTFSEDVQAGIGTVTIIDGDSATHSSYDVTGTNVSVNGNVVTIITSSALVKGTAYSVQISAGGFTDLWYNQFAGISDDTTWDFFTEYTSVTPPTNTSPTDGEVISDRTPLLDWTDVTSSTGYRIQVNTTIDFTGTMVEDDDTVSVSEFTPSELELTDFFTTYYWRVKTVNAEGWSNWSSVWSFDVSKIPSIPWPPDSSTIVDTTPVLDWESIAESSGYHIQIGSDIGFGTGTIITEDDTLIDSEFETALSDNTTYYWRVKGKNTSGTWGLWGATWEFSIKTDFQVGDEILGEGGGLIFYDKGSYSEGWRYLEAAPASTEWSGREWGADGTDIPGAEGIAVGTGKQNTTDIVDYLGTGSRYAAQLCDGLSERGCNDWFLPSKDELNLMYENLHEQDLGGFADRNYWSSSEFSADYAWGQDFSTGNQYDSSIKGYSGGADGRVRAVRAF